MTYRAQGEKRPEDGPRRKQIRLVAGAILVILGLCLTSAAGGPGDQLCFPSTTWFGGAQPVIDGNIDGDPAWRGAFKYRFDNGTTNPDVVVQGIRDATNSNIFLSVQANNLKDWDQFSAVALAFDPSNGADATKQQLIVIYPVIAGAMPGVPSPPTSPTEYYHGFPWGVSSPWAPLAEIVTGYQTAGAGHYQWSMEARLPIDPTGNNGVAIPAAGSFAFYVTVLTIPNELPTDIPGTGAVTERDWPNDAPMLGCDGSNPTTCTIPALLPPENKWGKGSIDPATGCLGVSVSSQTGNIYTSSSPDNLIISLNHPNTFFAYIQNTMVDSGGNPVAAQGVKASFKIANFGLPAFGDWQIPGSEAGGSPIGGDPTTPGVSIPKSGINAALCSNPVNNNDANCTLQTGVWNLNASEQASYAVANSAHQCILVELDSDPGSNTVFLNNAAVQNMNFGMTASKFQRSAEISARGYPVPAHKTEQVFDLSVFTKAEVLNPAGGREGRVVSQLTWEAYGCRHTNTFVAVKGKTLELCDGVGAFGYVIRHLDTVGVDNWNIHLTGAGVETVSKSNGIYRVHVNPNSVGTVTTQAEPEYPGEDKFAVYADLGVGIPHGNFGSLFNPGFSFNSGLEYMINSHFSAEGIFGVHHFPAKVGSSVNLYQFSANAKVYMPLPPGVPSSKLKLFANGGIGGYKVSPGSSYFGGNFGTGLLYEFTAHVGLQGSYNFHVVNTPGSATKFSTIQGGIRYVF